MSKKIFYSPLLRLACGSYLLGVFISPLINWWILILILLGGLVISLFSRKYFYIIILTLFCIGVVQFGLAEKSMSHLGEGIWRVNEFSGTVTTYPKPQLHGIQSMIDLDDYSYLIALTTNQNLELGDEISFKCFLNKPFSSPQFDQKMMLWNKGVTALCTTQDVQVIKHVSPFNPLWLPSRLRQIMNSKFENLLPDDLAGLYQGILLGNTSKLSKEIKDQFKNTGTTHVMAVSGFNVSIMIAMVAFFGTALKLKRKLNLFLSLSAIFLLWGMVGSSASVVRAVSMGILVLFAAYNYRYTNRRTILILVATVMTVLNPFAIRYDIGFQLSFVATYALIVFTPKIERLILPTGTKTRLQQFLSSNLLPTIVAYTSTVFIIWIHFSRISWTAIATNIFIAPLIPILMLVGICGVIIAGIMPWMSLLCTIVLTVLAKLLLFIVSWFSVTEDLNYLNWRVELVIMFYAFCIFLIIFLRKKAPSPK